MDLEFLKDRYDYELQRKEQLTAALALPVGVLSGLGGLIALMSRSFSYTNPVLTWLFMPLAVADVLAFFACLVQLARAYHRQTYMYLPLLRELHGFEEEFREFLDYVRDTGGDAEQTFNEHLRERIIEAADRNTLNNDERSRLLYWSRITLFAVLFLTALAGIPYVADQVRY